MNLSMDAVVDEKRLKKVVSELTKQVKTPWRNGTTHVERDPVDFIVKLAALMPPPRAHLTRFHSVGEGDRTSCATPKQ